MSTCGPLDWIGAARRLITEHRRAVLIMITADKGSTPRNSGTWMLVSDDGQSGTWAAANLNDWPKKRPVPCWLDMVTGSAVHCIVHWARTSGSVVVVTVSYTHLTLPTKA